MKVRVSTVEFRYIVPEENIYYFYVDVSEFRRPYAPNYPQRERVYYPQQHTIVSNPISEVSSYDPLKGGCKLTKVLLNVHTTDQHICEKIERENQTFRYHSES